MRKAMKYLLKFIGLSFLALPLTACSLSGETMDGQVLEEGTGKPVAGAIVVVRWTGNDSSGLFDGHGVCYHVETATTDATGKFHIGRWSDGASTRSFFIGNRAIYKEAYKVGYTRPQIPSNKPETILVAPVKATADEYLTGLFHLQGCSGGGESTKNLYRLYMTLFEQVKTISERPDQLRRAEEQFIRAANDALVDHTKPMIYKNGSWINVNADDNYKKEEFKQ